MRRVVIKLSLLLIILWMYGCESESVIPDGYKSCFHCHGRGRINLCGKCNGSGQMSCPGIHTTSYGEKDFLSCHMCRGTGRIVCDMCFGNSGYLCAVCGGAGFVKE